MTIIVLSYLCKLFSIRDRDGGLFLIGKIKEIYQKTQRNEHTSKRSNVAWSSLVEHNSLLILSNGASIT